MPKNVIKIYSKINIRTFIAAPIYYIKGDMFVYLFICLFVCIADGRPNGWADQDQTWDGDSCWPRECFSPDRGQQEPIEFQRSAR